MLLVNKKDGTKRPCIDFRKLNAVTTKDAYPMPRIDDMLDALGGKSFFSTLDLASGYWQIPVHADDREKTAFATDDGLFECVGLPFGLVNAPATFQRAMDSVLHEMLGKNCMAYLDDIIVFSSSWEEHRDDLHQVMDRLAKANLVVNMKKCFFARSELKYLGHLVSAQGVRMDPDKIKAVQRVQTPKTAKQLQAFLGMVNYYRQFIRDLAKIAKPLYRLSSDKQPWHWTDLEETSFTRLKAALVEAPVLTHPDWNLPFILQTDASDVAIAAVLAQRQGDQEKVVAFASKTLQPAERNYSATERECLAVVHWIEFFRCYLEGKAFKVVTDHAALQWLRTNDSPNGKLQRWRLKLQGYDFEVIHRPGSKHQNVDALTRAPFIAESEVAARPTLPQAAQAAPPRESAKGAIQIINQDVFDIDWSKRNESLWILDPP
jgi:hypothetical protein